jgi:hypothetical protein
VWGLAEGSVDPSVRKARGPQDDKVGMRAELRMAKLEFPADSVDRVS